MSAIKIKNLTKSFGSFKAVNDISFNVSENKVFGFLGPNGAGKTTTIRMLVGLSRPTDGEIEIVGEKMVFGKPEANKLIGYLPEQPSFYNWMSGVEYLNFIADIFKIEPKEKKNRIKELLELVGLSGANNKRIGAYSNGMKQRLGIAQALINKPKVLIMDEPVSALDPIGRKEILSIIERIKETTTVFMSTHILSDVDRICDEIAIIKNGKILITSSLAELKEKYATAILEVELGEEVTSKIVEAAKKQKWVKRIESNGNKLKVWLTETSAMDNNAPLEFLLSQKVSIMKYGLVLPEVEDLFMEILEKNK